MTMKLHYGFLKKSRCTTAVILCFAKKDNERSMIIIPRWRAETMFIVSASNKILLHDTIFLMYKGREMQMTQDCVFYI